MCVCRSVPGSRVGGMLWFCKGAREVSVCVKWVEAGCSTLLQGAGDKGTRTHGAEGSPKHEVRLYMVQEKTPSCTGHTHLTLHTAGHISYYLPLGMSYARFLRVCRTFNIYQLVLWWLLVDCQHKYWKIYSALLHNLHWFEENIIFAKCVFKGLITLFFTTMKERAQVESVVPSFISYITNAFLISVLQRDEFICMLHNFHGCFSASLSQSC